MFNKFCLIIMFIFNNHHTALKIRKLKKNILEKLATTNLYCNVKKRTVRCDRFNTMQ